MPAPSPDPVVAPASVPRPKRNLILTFGTNLGILGLTVATGTLNARLLGPTGRGELAAIQTIPSVLGMIALLGLPSAVGYFSARRPAEARTFTVTALVLSLFASVPAIVAGYFLLPWALKSQTHTVVHDARVYLIFVALYGVNFPYMALQGLGKFGVWNLLRLAPNIASFIAILVVFAGGSPNSGSLSRWYLFTFALIGPLTYATLWWQTSSSADAGGSTLPRAKEMLRYGLPSALMVPAGLLNLQLDQMVMAAWLPSNLLGLYAVSVSWSGLISPAFGALGSMVFPALAAATDPEAQRALVARSLRMAVLVVLGLGAGLAVVTPLLLPRFFGSSFAPAVPTALVLVGAGMVLNLNNLCGEVLRGLGAPRWPLYSQMASLPVTAALLVLLLPRWDILGAATSSLIAYVVALCVSIAGIRSTCGLTLGNLLIPRREDYTTIWSTLRSALPLRR